jgi:transcriptional regulator with XRE-family HTH domain
MPRDFPEKLLAKLKAIRERLGMTPDQLAGFVGAKTGAEILAYENDEDDLLVSVLFGYAKIANVQVENLLHDDRDLWLGHRNELNETETL